MKQSNFERAKEIDNEMRILIDALSKFSEKRTIIISCRKAEITNEMFEGQFSYFCEQVKIGLLRTIAKRIKELKVEFEQL